MSKLESILLKLFYRCKEYFKRFDISDDQVVAISFASVIIAGAGSLLSSPVLVGLSAASLGFIFTLCIEEVFNGPDDDSDSDFE